MLTSTIRDNESWFVSQYTRKSMDKEPEYTLKITIILCLLKSFLSAAGLEIAGSWKAAAKGNYSVHLHLDSTPPTCIPNFPSPSSWTLLVVRLTSPFDSRVPDKASR